jgi:hypothetical protein
MGAPDHHDNALRAPTRGTTRRAGSDVTRAACVAKLNIDSPATSIAGIPQPKVA